MSNSNNVLNFIPALKCRQIDTLKGEFILVFNLLSRICIQLNREWRQSETMTKRLPTGIVWKIATISESQILSNLRQWYLWIKVRTNTLHLQINKSLDHLVSCILSNRERYIWKTYYNTMKMCYMSKVEHWWLHLDCWKSRHSNKNIS